MVLGKDSSELKRSMEGLHKESGDRFRISGAFVNIAKEEYRGHKIHRNTPVNFWLWFSRLCDRKIKQSSFTYSNSSDNRRQNGG
jgi:hypothetical protein